MLLRFITVLSATAFFTSHVQGQTMDEYKIKAAFLYNFAKFVDWPPQAFKTPHDPFLICVLGRNPFGDALKEVIRGKSIEGRPFEFRDVRNASEASGCQILFVGSEEGRRFHSILQGPKALGILTVGEAQGFAESGGVINFIRDDGHVHFEINVDAAEQEQLHISSKLLGLAEIVKKESSR